MAPPSYYGNPLRRLLSLLLLWPLCSSATTLRLPPGNSATLTFAEQNSAAAITLLLVRARLDLPIGSEGWGGHLLGLQWNGAELPAPCNTPLYVTDLCCLPHQATPLYDSVGRRWFVRADSDFIPFNALRPGGPWQREAFLGRANSGSDLAGYRNAYYDKVFRLPPQSLPGTLQLQNDSPDYELVVEVDHWQGERSDLLFFVPAAGRSVMPDTFPALEELRHERRWRVARNERHSLLLGARSLAAAESFEWQLGSWRSDAGDELPAGSFDVRFLSYEESAADALIPQQYRHYPQRKGGVELLPDRLVGSSRWEVPAGGSSLMWLIVTIPQATPPGVYRSQLQLNGEASLSLELEVLPLVLEELSTIRGLWTNTLPGRDEAVRRRQIDDLRTHGVNTFFLDPWTVPLPVADDGTPDLSRFNEALTWLRHERFNRQVLIYGVLGPLLKRMEALAGSATPDNAIWCALAAKVFLPLQSAANEAGFTLYLHPYDEPDVHPKSTEKFIKFCKAIRTIPGLKTASNITAAGQQQLGELIDLNICNSGFAALAATIPFPNDFFPKWAAATPAWIRKNIDYVYTQTRSTAGHQARLHYGLGAEAAGLKGVWGFAYHWGSHNWHIAWPFPEADGRCGTTFGWEMLSLGVNDSRYWQMLQQQRPALKLPDPAAVLRLSELDLARWREEIVTALLDPDYQPQPTVANSVRPSRPAPPGKATEISLDGLIQVPVVNYAVYPGNSQKVSWNRLDHDWTKSEDPARRLGQLCDETPQPPTKVTVCYNFWRADPADSYISVVIELPQVVDVAAVTIDGSNHSDMYRVSHAELSRSYDGTLFGEAASVASAVVDERGLGWEIRLPGCGTARLLLVTVWGDPNRHLNLSKIRVYGQ